MKRILLTLTALLTIIYSSNSQITVDSPQYNKLKAAGNAPSNPVQVNGGIIKPQIQPAGSPKSGCNCYQAPDATYTLAMGPNDDGSTPAIPIPFNFCLYGTTYGQMYINNNGNVTFDVPYSTFSAVGFPSASYVMVAPFWGDVDTRNGNGQVFYKVTPTAIYVNWVGVGYYNQHGDKLNTFQLIITDGTDPVVPNGNNIAFCYEDMQWTTGDASQGVGGFGGTPATVGVNKGNGVDFIQFGRFDQPGAAYDGPVGANDGVDWLDYQSLFFNACSNVNIPPIFGDLGLGGNSGASGGNLCGSDTVKLCAIGDGDTLIFNPSFLGPENGETVTVTANFFGMTGASVISNSPGNPGSIGVMIVGDASNAGYHYIEFNGTDDGTPSQSTTVGITIHVDTTNNYLFNPTILGDTVACENTTLALEDAYTYDDYTWSHDPSDSTLYTDTSGTYWVTVQSQGCFKSELVNVLITGNPDPQVSGNLFICPGDSTLISVDLINSTLLPYDSLDWGIGLDTVSSHYYTAGNHNLVVVDTNGCIGDVDFTISQSTPLALTVAPFDFCDTLSGQITNGFNQGEDGGTWTFIGPSGSNLNFSNNTLHPTVTADTYGSYELIYTDPCGEMDTMSMSFGYQPTAVLSDTFVCSESISTIILDPGTADPQAQNFSWSTGDTTAFISVDTAGVYIVTVSNACGSASDTSVIENISITFPSADVEMCGLSYAFPAGSVDAPNGGYWTYSGNSSDTLNFSPSEGEETPTISTNNFTTYNLTFTDSLCGIEKTIEVEFISWAYTNISGDTICLGSDLLLNGNQAIDQTYLWSTGETTPTIIVNQTGEYILTVSNSCNTHTDTAYVFVENCTCSIPNIITPNGDAMNDELYIDCALDYEKDALQVFDRWGVKVFESSNYQNDWKGTNMNGSKLSDGQYLYIYTVEERDEVMRGYITVISD